MSREPQKARVAIANADTTSNSECVLELVMSYLPTKDCVRTSILSSKWRFRWTTIQSLVFDRYNCYPASCKGNTKMESIVLASIISRVLLIHSGSIQVFEVKHLDHVPDIDCWILHISKHTIQTLVLDLCGWSSVPYKLPSSLFTCGSLRNLRLGECLLRPPSSFKGFKNLKCLELGCVTLTNDAFESLISSCPLLEKLALKDLKKADNLKINAPNLQDVSVVGKFSSITFGCALTRLSVICIDAPGCAYASLLDFFIKLPNIQRLELKRCHLGYMADAPILEGLPFQCKDLCHLAISMNLSSSDYCSPTFYIYRSPTNLTEKKIKDLSDCYLAIELGVWEENSPVAQVNKFEQLRRVRMDNFSGKSAELRLVKSVLENSPVLEEMTVNPNPPYGEDIKWKDVRSISRFKRASSKARIIFEGIGM